MTVAELIAKLQKLDPKAEVCVMSSDDDFADIITKEIGVTTVHETYFGSEFAPDSRQLPGNTVVLQVSEWYGSEWNRIEPAAPDLDDE